jgi:hypothetical protein
LLVPCTSKASLPIDIHVSADHPNEPTSGTAFAHLAALAFPSVALPARACHSVSRSWFARCLACGLHCPSLSFDVVLRGLHGLGLAPPFVYLGQARRAAAISHGSSNQWQMRR